jgi:antitoxin component of MazEF toxin-antitoxin module
METKSFNLTDSIIISVVKLVELHATPKRVGNSWAILIPKEKADELKLDNKTELHVEFKKVPKMQDMAGTLKTKKSTKQIMKEIDEGWDD